MEAFVPSIDDLDAEIDTMEPSGHQFRYLVASESVAGQALAWIHQNISSPGVFGAFAAAGISEYICDWDDPLATAGVVHYYKSIFQYRELEISSGILNQKRALDFLKYKSKNIVDQVDALQSTVSEITSNARGMSVNLKGELGNIYTQSIASAQEWYSKKILEISAKADELAQANASINATRDRGIEDLERHRAAYREEHLLQPAAKLWSDRATDHRKAAFWSGVLATAVGAFGTVATVAIFPILRAKAAGQFAAPVPAGANAKVAEEIIAAGLHYELAFAGAGTLLCLTMFLWLMRILVRRYTTHRRLAVDAAGRQALTLTYIGLIAEGAVNENERPIVLASLFLPVTDNSVDDGPPATSLASILAAIAAGKSGAS
ncbi:DUF6161 domain-containing protein [uncultured Sphingomonas sp.]|uniref:DUF6161 domain-containing protein n=1 Tax=uncultured Sphingomonas sp. TaxID=158754 RepID=UPI0037483632